MLEELRNIRRLLTVPGPENVRMANAELERLAPFLDQMSKTWREQRESQASVLKSTAALKAELLAICSLSQAAADYFARSGQVHAFAFGAYGRTGNVRSLDDSSRTIARL